MNIHIGSFVTSMLLVSGGQCRGKILLLGGLANSPANYTEVLSPDMLQPLENCSFPAIPNYRSISVPLRIGSSAGLLACGGHPQTDQCWLYLQSWTKGPSLPQPLRGGSMSSKGETAYYIGGRNKAYKKTKTIYKYNEHVGRWLDAGQSLSGEREYHCSVVLEQYLYVLGGADKQYRDLAVVEKFRIGTLGSLEPAPSPPYLSVARRSHGCAVFQDSGMEKIIVAGGYQREGGVDTVEVWWPGKATIEGKPAWKQAGKLPSWRFAFTLTALPQLLVIAGGETRSGRTETSTLTSSNNGNFWMPGPDLRHGRSYHSAVVMDQGHAWC